MPLVDSFLPARRRRIRIVAPPQQPTAPQPFIIHAPQRKHSWLAWLQILLIFIFATALGFMAQSQTAGDSIIAGYTLVALALRISSRVTFGFALIAFIFVLGLLLLYPQDMLIANFSVYAFLLLASGAISLMIENRRRLSPLERHRKELREKSKRYTSRSSSK